MAPQLFRFCLVRVGALATGIVASLAEEAFAAGDGERHNHTVADLELGVAGADLDHLAHGLVTDDVALLHLGDDAVIDVQIGATDGAGRDLDDRVARIHEYSGLARSRTAYRLCRASTALS